MMIIVRQILVLFIALSVGLATFSTPGMPRTSGENSTLVICSANGVQTITLDAKGNPVSNGTQHHDCFLCCLMLAAVPVLPAQAEIHRLSDRAVFTPIQRSVVVHPVAKRMSIRAPPEGYGLL